MSNPAFSRRRKKNNKKNVVQDQIFQQELQNVLQESNLLSQELQNQFQNLNISLDVPIPRLDSIQPPANANEIQATIVESRKLSMQIQLLKQQLDLQSVVPGHISTPISFHVSPNVALNMIPQTSTIDQIQMQTPEIQTQAQPQGKIASFTGIVLNITAIGVNLYVTMLLNPLLPFGAGLVGTLAGNIITNIPIIISGNSKKEIFARQFTAAATGYVATSIGSQYLGTFAGTIVGTIIGNIAVGSLYGSLELSKSPSLVGGELASEAILQQQAARLQSNINAQSVSDTAKSTSRLQKLLYVTAAATALTGILMSANAETLINAGIETTKLGIDLYKGNPFVKGLANRTLAILLAPYVLPKLVKWANKRADIILGQAGNLSLKDIDLIKKNLSDRILKQLIFNITLSEVLKLTVKASSEQIVKVGIETGVQAASNAQQTLDDFLSQTIKGVETVTEYVNNAVQNGQTNLADVINGAVESPTLTERTNSLLNDIFEPKSVSSDTSTFADVNVEQTQETLQEIKSELENLFAPTSISETQSTISDAPVDYKEKFYREHPEWKDILQYSPHELNGLLWYAVTGQVSAVLNTYEKAKFGIQSGLFMGNIIERQISGKISADTVVHQFMSGLENAEKAVGLNKIQGLGSFSVEEAVIAAFGYHPTFSRGDVVDKLLLGDSVHGYIESLLGQGVTETVFNIPALFGFMSS